MLLCLDFLRPEVIDSLTFRPDRAFKGWQRDGTWRLDLTWLPEELKASITEYNSIHQAASQLCEVFYEMVRKATYG